MSNIAGSVISSNATLTLTNLLHRRSPGCLRPSSVQAGGMVKLNLSGTTDATYTLEISTNLTTWTPLATLNMTNGAIQIWIHTASNSPVRFYMLVSP